MTDMSSPGNAAVAARTTGILPSQVLRQMIARAEITAAVAIDELQIQPASIDLRLGNKAYRVPASFLPGPDATVLEKLAELSMHEIDLRDGAVLEKGCVYIVPVLEELALPARVSAAANPKSSTGRLDIFTRLICDHAMEFETVAAGYCGPLYTEISPRTFSVLVRTGSRLNQLRLRRGTPAASDSAMRRLQNEVGLVHGADVDIREGVAVSVDLRGVDGLIGYRAKPHAGLIDVDRPDSYAVDGFWEPLHAGKSGVGGADGLILNPDEFYILASKEFITVPLDYAAEMRAYDTKVGEFRVHYAGFFDPGFGHDQVDGAGTRAVLEVRAHDVPYLIEDGQVVCRLVYEALTMVPDKLYGSAGIGSNYQRQGLKLSKHFKT
jgi:dCTP deaminase